MASSRRIQLAFALFLFSFVVIPIQSFSMTWQSTWDDILQGGSPRWKVDDPKIKEQALATIVKYCDDDTNPLHILCPLAGDDSFVRVAWENGHSVTSIDLVPAAVEALRQQISSGAWESSELPSGHTQWKHSSNRAVFYVGDALLPMEHLNHSFDAIYDKDSFGALDLSMRSPFSQRMAEYIKPNGILYTEVKNKADPIGGPPYHVEKSDLMESFGDYFEYVASLGQVYELSMPNMKQMGHILRRLAK